MEEARRGLAEIALLLVGARAIASQIAVSVRRSIEALEFRSPALFPAAVSAHPREELGHLAVRAAAGIALLIGVAQVYTSRASKPLLVLAMKRVSSPTRGPRP